MSLNTSLNVATLLVLAGAAVYFTILPFTTWGGDE